MSGRGGDGSRAATAAEHELQRQLWIQRMIAELSRRFLELAPEEFEDGVRRHLATASALAGAERTRLVVMEPGQGAIQHLYEWCADGILSARPGEIERGLRMRWAIRTLARGEPLHVPRVDALPHEAAAERRDLAVRGVRSLLVIPVSAGSSLVGYAIFERMGFERGWSEQEITQLRLVGEIFASALERRRTEAALERQRRVEQRVAELSRRLLALGADEIDEGIEAALAEAADIAGADRSTLISFARRPDGCFESYEWCGPGVAPVPPAAQGLGWSSAKTLAGEVLHIPRVDALPPEAAQEREHLASRGVRSLLGIPVLSGSQAIGYLGFETMAFEKAWSVQEVTLLRMLGELFTSALRRKRTENRLRQSQEQLLQAQKLDAVGRLAGGIAHDFNNLLTVILGFSRPLLQELPEEDPVRQDVREMHDAAERAAALTRQLLTFSRRQAVRSQAVDLSRTARGLEGMLRRLLGEDVELVLDAAPDLCAVDVDPHQFEQVLLNLAVNARDAMPDGGQLLVRTEDRDVTPREAADLGLSRAGACVCLTVADTGSGIDEETRTHMFEPFFTTKEPGKGTGLGLSIVYSTVEQARGAIRVHAPPGKGTVFEIWLPALDSAAATDEPVQASHPQRGSECVLLVEDQAAVRRLTRRILAEGGYRVLEQSDGAAALALAAEYEGPIDLLVSDVVMPRLGGPELARRLREQRPGLRVLFISGYPMDEPRSTRSEAAFLQKPFTAYSLRAKVREVLDP